MEIIEEPLEYDYDSTNLTWWSQNDVYAVTVLFVLFPAFMMSFIVAIYVNYPQEIPLKLKIFIQHLMISYLISSVFDAMEALRLHMNFFDPDTLVYWLIYPFVVTILFAKYLLILLLLIHRENMPVATLRPLLNTVWITALFYLSILSVLTVNYRDIYGMALVIVPANINLSVFIVVTLIYLVISYFLLRKCCKKILLSDQMKIRFGVVTTALIGSLVHIFIERTVPLLWPYLSLYIVDSLEVLVIVVLLIKFGCDFRITNDNPVNV